jgi:hypothetical protein
MCGEGGTKGYKASPETKEKLRAAATGKTASPETRKKMSDTHKNIPHPGSAPGQKRSAETKAKMSKANLRRIADGTYVPPVCDNLGRKHTADSRANMGASRLGKKRGPYKKKEMVIQENKSC